MPSSNEGKPACLLVLSASKLGNFCGIPFNDFSALKIHFFCSGNAFGSFVETFKLLLAEFDVQIATPNVSCSLTVRIYGS